MSSTADTSYKNTGGRQTKFASIPEPPGDASPSLKKWMAAVKETVEVREGKRGNSLDRSIIVRDLFDPSFTSKYWPDGSSTGNPNTSPGAAQGDTTPPGPVGAFLLDASGATQNILTWTDPIDSDLDYVEIRGAYVNGIAVWTSEGSYHLGDLIRFTYNGFNYIYEVIAVDPEGTGATELSGISPEDPKYGNSGSSTQCWMRQGYPHKVVANAKPLAVVPPGVQTWTHVLTGAALTQDWYYYAKAVDRSANSSPWNPDGGEGLFALAKTNMGVTPDPTNLMICESGSTTEFNSLDINLCWSPSTKYNVKDYIIDVIPTATITEATPNGVRIRHVDSIRGSKWTYTYTDNKTDNGGTAEDELTFRLWAVDQYDQVSQGYDEISVYNPPPADISEITPESWFRSVRFMWSPNTEPDIDGYVYCVFVGDGNPATGAAYPAWQTALWGDSYDHEVEIAMISYALTDAQIDTEYSYGGPYVYVLVKARDTWGNVSENGVFSYYFPGRPVEPKEITDFAMDASKMFLRIPVLESDVWHTNNPSSGSISWSQHNLYYNGKCYQITAGNTSNKYIYWEKPSSPSGSGTQDDPYISTYSSSATHPGDDGVLGDDDFIIAVNNDGIYDLAWNAIANQVIGSAYIMDAAITNAKIDWLDANKITAGILKSRLWDSGGGGMYFNIDSGDLKIGDSPTDIALKWDNTAKQLTLKGAIVQSPGGTEYPITLYRGAWGDHSVGTVFYEADTITYGGSTWVCTAQHTKNSTNFPDVVPPGSAYWGIYAQEGEKGDDGVAGERGPGVAFRGEYAEIYLTTDFVSTADVRDVVKFSGSYYICKQSHGPTTGGLHDPSEGAYWEGFGASFSSVATGLLLANDATILQTLVFGNAVTQTGAIRSFGKSTYLDSTNGFWMGWDSGIPKVNIGDGTNWLKWTGTALSVGGSIIATGNIMGNAVSATVVETSTTLITSASFTSTPYAILTGQMSLAAEDSISVLINAYVTVYGGSPTEYRQVHIPWVDTTATAGTSPYYYFYVVQDGATRTLFALYRGGTELTRIMVSFGGWAITGITPAGTQAMMTLLHLKR